jgi:hypothetical protein
MKGIAWNSEEWDVRDGFDIFSGITVSLFPCYKKAQLYANAYDVQ